jgi:hypothetical protein
MIRLTEVCYDHLGNPYEKSIVVPDNIVIKDEPSNRIGGGNCKIVVLGVGKYEVKETFEEVARKVLEYRLSMERYRAIASAEAQTKGEEAKMLSWARENERSILNQFAGLEEQA